MVDTAHPEQLAARAHLERHGWILGRRSEAFRHLPPPAAARWLDDTGDAAAPGAGWTLTPSIPAHVTVRHLNALDTGERAQLLAGLPAPGDGEAAPFAWAHRALCREGLRLAVQAPGGAAATPLHLHHHSCATAQAPLVVLDVEAGAHCVLLETHSFAPAGAQNLQLHIHLAPGARLHHLRVVGAGAQDRIAHHWRATLGAGAQYRQATVATAGGYHLQRGTLELQGPGAQAHTAALLLAGPAGQVDQQTWTRMDAPRTTSTVETLALAQGGSHAVANAHTRIAPGADEASVHQRLTGIPLGGHPRLVLRPHLEILHDNVRAAHGATWGALPEDALFYARQRGLSDAGARALIIEGMARALLERALGDGPDGTGLLAPWLAQGWLGGAIAAQLQASGEAHRG